MSKPPVISLFNHVIQSKMLSHAYLLYGNQSQSLTLLSQSIVEHYIQIHHSSLSDGPRSFSNHPDIVHLDKQSSIKIDDIQTIHHLVKYGPSQLDTYFVIIDDIHLLTPQACNSFLKFLEEPQHNITFFLNTTAIQHLLPTIKSRCQCVFVPTSSQTIDSTDNHMSYSQFCSLSIKDRYAFIQTIVNQKDDVLKLLHQWLHELYGSQSQFHHFQSYDNILSLIQRLQTNVNSRLQLESFAISLN